MGLCTKFGYDIRVTRCPALFGTVTHFHYIVHVPQIETLSHIVIDSQGALTLGHLAVAVAVLAPNRAQICQCECGQSG